jgi:hypothetical protein
VFLQIICSRFHRLPAAFPDRSGAWGAALNGSAPGKESPHPCSIDTTSRFIESESGCGTKTRWHLFTFTHIETIYTTNTATAAAKAATTMADGGKEPESNVGTYLARRLMQIGVKDYFAVPGTTLGVCFDRPRIRTPDQSSGDALGAKLITMNPIKTAIDNRRLQFVVAGPTAQVPRRPEAHLLVRALLCCMPRPYPQNQIRSRSLFRIFHPHSD